MKKRFLSLLLVACLVTPMVIACGSSTGTSLPTPTAAAPQASDPRVVAKPNPSAPTATPQTIEPMVAAPQASGTASGQTTVVFTDSAGRKVEVPKNITRIVPSGPLAQMVIFALAPEKFVGLAGKWSTETEQYINTEYYRLPVLGQLYGSGSTLNLEEIARIGPQVVIDVGEAKSSIVEDMDKLQKQLGIHLFYHCKLTEAQFNTLVKNSLGAQ